MYKKLLVGFFCLNFQILAVSSFNVAFANNEDDIESLKRDIIDMKKIYEEKINNLENKLADLEKNIEPVATSSSSDSHEDHDEHGGLNTTIAAVLNGKYTSYSESSHEIPGFSLGEEGERGREGLAIDESELIINSNLDNKFASSLTAAIVREDGADKIELEEAYLETLNAKILPDNFFAKAGRAFWTLGALNEQHTHADNFADRPLPYRVFLHKSYNDDGVEFSYLFPSNFYHEIGAGIFRGDDFPFGSNNSQGSDAWSAYYRTGGDINFNQSWNLGTYVLSGKSRNGRTSNEDTLTFKGDSELLILNLGYTIKRKDNKAINIQAEYFTRNQDGYFNDSDAETGDVYFDDDDGGWYVELYSKESNNMGYGFRYSKLNAPSVPSGLVGSSMDSSNHDPEVYNVMADWKMSNLSRLRLQYNYENVTNSIGDNQFMLQYIINTSGDHGHDH